MTGTEEQEGICYDCHNTVKCQICGEEFELGIDEMGDFIINRKVTCDDCYGDMDWRMNK